MSRFHTYVFIALLASSIASAQDLSGPSFSVDPKVLLKAANGISQEKPSSVTILLEEHVFDFDKESKVVETIHSIYRINTAEGVDGWSESSARWEPWHQTRPEIRTRVITPEGEVRSLDPKTLTDRPVHEESTIYTDDRRLAAPIPAVTPGAVIEEEIVIRDTSTFFAAGVSQRTFFVQSVPVSKTRLLLRHPTSLPIVYSLKLLPKATVQKHEANGVEEILIENGASEPYESVTSAPPDVIVYPQVVFGTGRSWHDIASTYSQMAEQKLEQPIPDKEMESAIPAGASESEKVKRLVAFLHKKVRYTGVEFGEAALIPQPPTETWKRGYGDCKDKSALLVSMLRHFGVPARLALLQTGPGADIDPEIPGMGVFDHAIVFVPGPHPQWIDATAEYTPVGSLPVDDQGRLALVIDADTATLTKTPEAKPEDNLLIENREIHLSEYGPAEITESWEPHGDIEAEYRAYYTPDQKEKRKKELETYVKSAYLAESLSKMEPGENTDLLKPFAMKLEVKRGRRGFTAIHDAVVVIQHAYLTDRLPSELRTDKKEKNDEEKKRTIDYVIAPFVTEWRYRIYPPAGFQVRNLPSPVERKIGPTLLKETFATDSNGTVIATLRFDTLKSRFTPEEAEALREAAAKFRGEDHLEISFDHLGHSLLSRGKIAEGLAKYQEAISANPTSALQRVRFASALLSAGLGEKARRVAAEAVKLDPNSAPAEAELGWILKHDLIGRESKLGFDYEGAIAAYKKAIALDPKDSQSRINLAVTYEYDKWGIRYTRNAHLKEAIEQFRQLQKDDEDKFKEYQDNVLYDLFYSARFQELFDESAKLSMTDARRGLVIASTAAAQNVEAAEKRALDLTSDDAERNKLLVSAGQLLLRMRLYEKGTALLTAGTQGSAGSQVTQQQIAAFARTRKYEEMPIDKSSPVGLAQKLVRIWFSVDSKPEDYIALMSKNALSENRAKDVSEAQKSLPLLRTIVIDSGLPPDVFLDLALSNLKVTTDGDDEHGYRVTLQSVGSPTQYMYVVKEGGEYKLLGIGNGKEIGREVLDRLAKGDISSAKMMLDFVRDRQPLGGGDDPLAGNLFPRFWTKGESADTDSMRLAAISMLVETDSISRYVPALEEANRKAPDSQRANFDLALALAYDQLHNWQQLKSASQRLLKSSPRSDRALALFGRACIQLKQWSEGEAAVQDRLAVEPDSLAAKRLLARLHAEKGAFDASFKELRNISEDGRATADDFNLFGWSGLFLPSVPPEAVEAAERANVLTQQQNFGVLHTLACLYAETGKTIEARNLLIRAIQTAHLAEPNSALWYGFGRLAELYGQPDAAIAIYKRVESPEASAATDAFSTYNLVQARIRDLTKRFSKEIAAGN